jgi:hypothetical protein
VARLPGEAPSPIFFDFFIFTLDPGGVSLTGFDLLAAGARAPRL